MADSIDKIDFLHTIGKQIQNKYMLWESLDGDEYDFSYLNQVNESNHKIINSVTYKIESTEHIPGLYYTPRMLYTNIEFNGEIVKSTVSDDYGIDFEIFYALSDDIIDNVYPASNLGVSICQLFNESPNGKLLAKWLNRLGGVHIEFVGNRLRVGLNEQSNKRIILPICNDTINYITNYYLIMEVIASAIENHLIRGNKISDDYFNLGYQYMWLNLHTNNGNELKY